MRSNFNDGFEAALFRKFFVCFLEVDHNARTTPFTFNRFNFIGAGAVAAPAEGFTLWLPRAGVDLHFIGHHKDGVEANTELSD